MSKLTPLEKEFLRDLQVVLKKHGATIEHFHSSIGVTHNGEACHTLTFNAIGDTFVTRLYQNRDEIFQQDIEQDD